MKIDLKRSQKAEHKRREIMAAYWSDNHAAAALASIRALARQEPLLPILQADLVTLAIAISEYDQALLAAKRLLKLAPGDFFAARSAAAAFSFCGQEEKALAAWQSVTTPEHRATALAAMARLEERAGRLDEAAAWITEALARDPRDAMSVLTAGRIASKQGDTDRAIGMLERCTHPAVPHALRGQALYELGEIQDRRGDPARAVEMWRAAKQCLEEGFPGDVELGRRIRRKTLERNRRLIESLTPALMRHWRNQAPASKLPPVAVLVGHPRSGTTLLEQVLAAHPDVRDIDEQDALACAVRETMFPGVPDGPDLATLDAMPADLLAATRRDYLRRVTMLREIGPDTRLLLDKNPNLTDFLPFLVRPLPELRLLVARRDPRDILLSCYRLPVLPQTGNIAWLREDHAAEEYRSIMAVWEKLRDCLGDDPGWLEVSYEALCSDLGGEARKVTAFLGLDWHPDQTNYRQVRAKARVASPSYDAVRAPVHTASVGRWHRYADLLPKLFEGFGR
jgi:tetratricopeptide (TPR) repeat protein